MTKHFDTASLVVIAITFVLFVLALFTQGFTHDLFLEAGIFLVSVKLIFLGYRNSVANRQLTSNLQEIKEMLAKALNQAP